MDPKLWAKLSQIYRSPELQKVFREFGAIGGKTRAKRLTPEQRRRIAKKAAQARWKKQRRNRG